MRRFLLLDDEINVLHALNRTLRLCLFGTEFQVEMFTDPEQALLRSAEVPFDVVVSDYRMQGMNGIEFLKMIKAIQPDAVRLMLSASTEFHTAFDAINDAEVFRYISKPWQKEELEVIFELTLARRDRNVAEQRLVDGFPAKDYGLTAQELEARRLEAEEPGITKVKWGPDGSVHLE
ncbi:MAG: signal transduction response regulator receiver domain protein [Burkholderia sp.]|jgi:two-component system probable response regulator PhcQ|nr:signal transduction response regulator receiver domain protein [Burkholderia sp.]